VVELADSQGQVELAELVQLRAVLQVEQVEQVQIVRLVPVAVVALLATSAQEVLVAPLTQTVQQMLVLVRAAAAPVILHLQLVVVVAVLGCLVKDQTV
jgi:hypothetical protein